IFFIATTTFREKKMEVKINLPQSKTMGSAAPAQEVRTSITVTPQKEIYLDGKPTPAEQLSQALLQLKQTTPDLKLELQADTETPLGLLMQIWDALRSAGYSVHDVPARIQRPE
ncbi:MAG: biopolymer transporter ExbD, partial [Prosthecobacter sp.]|nr:biopolymer transporter ExbD [Prosthecobacter sp.]